MAVYGIDGCIIVDERATCVYQVAVHKVAISWTDRSTKDQISENENQVRGVIFTGLCSRGAAYTIVEDSETKRSVVKKREKNEGDYPYEERTENRSEPENSLVVQCPYDKLNIRELLSYVKEHLQKIF